VKEDIKASFSHKEIGELIFSHLTTHLTDTQEGCASVAKYMAEDNTVQLPRNGKSKSAKSQARKSGEKIAEGLASKLVASPQKVVFREIMDYLCHACPTGNLAAAPMQPRNRLCEPVLPQANPIVDHPLPIRPSTQANNQHAVGCWLFDIKQE
jgi:hypothetical protein